MPVEGPDFSLAVPTNGYAWWYVDALSDDGAHGLTIIAFIGSVFSPYYARARRLGRGDPAHHCAINVALYGRSGKHWAMTERGRNNLSRTPSTFAAGPSALSWDASGLTIDIDELTVPIPKRIRGRVKVHANAINAQSFTLSEAGDHRWRPIMPLNRVEANFSAPGLTWSGPGYFDHNAGAAPLEDGFSSWTWSRSIETDGTTIFYEAATRTGESTPLALRFDTLGAFSHIPPPPAARLPHSGWGIARTTRSDWGAPLKVTETLENTPFYARSVIESTINGQPTKSMHESLSLERFANPVVQAMLAFKMPRRAG